MKQSLRAGLVSIILLFSFTHVWAYDQKSLLPVHTLKAGIESLYFKYEEPDYMQEDGALFGFVGNYTYHGTNHLMLDANIRLVFGELDYDGQTQDGTPATADTEDSIFETRGLIGFDFYLSNNFVFTPFAGIGYRYWNDDIGGSGGYEREIRYIYAPVGVRFAQIIDDNWSYGLNLEYDLFLNGEVKSHLSDVHPAFDDVENDQDFGDGYGIGFAIMINRKISDRFGLSFEPYIKYWDIDKSNVSYWTIYDIPFASGIEPANETTEVGLRVYFTF
ncbi:autotransporter domain-containing protein [Desulfococcaceae bacterium HSG7]|nr:autotransporter domain-containing protein [Desulfococcaceae bacterium HSG7]